MHTELNITFSCRFHIVNPWNFMLANCHYNKKNLYYHHTYRKPDSLDVRIREILHMYATSLCRPE